MRTTKFLLLILFLFGLDQGTKMWVFRAVDSEGFSVAPFLDFSLTWNKGISYGWLSSWQASYANMVLITANITIVSLLLFFLYRTHSYGRSLALSFVTAGALGNICDRLRYGAVIDFISFHIQSYYWYVFNLADVWITFGALGLIIYPFSSTQKTSSCAS